MYTIWLQLHNIQSTLDSHWLGCFPHLTSRHPCYRAPGAVGGASPKSALPSPGNWRLDYLIITITLLFNISTLPNSCSSQAAMQWTPAPAKTWFCCFCSWSLPLFMDGFITCLLLQQNTERSHISRVLSAHHGREVRAAEAGGSWSRCIHSQDAEGDKSSYIAHFLLELSRTTAGGVPHVSLGWAFPPHLT